MDQPKRTNAGSANGLSIILVEEFNADGILINKWYEVDGFPNKFLSLEDAEKFANDLEPESDLELEL